MKTRKRILLIALASAGALFFWRTVVAQETNAAAEREGATARTESVQAEAVEAAPEATAAPEAAVASQGQRRKGRVNREAIVMFGKDVELKEDEYAETVVVIFGSAKIRGHCDDCVVIGGDLEVEGEVQGSAVAVLGDVRAGQGAKIQGDAVAVGGALEITGDATVGGGKVGLNFPGAHAKWLRGWLVHCVFKLRPLALQVGWVWVVAALFFVFYLFVAAVFQRPVRACVEEVSRRPATTFFLGLLTILLLPLVLIILVATGVGVFVVPFLLAALVLGAIAGKVALAESLGIGLGRRFGVGALERPLAAFLVGSLIVTLLYLVWVVGLLTFMVLAVWSLGIAVTAAFGGLRREQPVRPVAPPLAPVAPAMTAASAAETPRDPAESMTGTGAAISVAASVPEVLSYPRASFWDRMGAAFLDVVVVSVLTALAHKSLPGLFGGPPMGFLIMLAYFSGMWAWKGTTIGGIVLGLRVARVDGQPVTFAVALVRALAAALSVMVLFLGFLWIAWDPEKQGWHDRIAGTVVLRLPRGTPLVCV